MRSRRERQEMQRCSGLFIRELSWQDRRNVMRRLAYHLKRVGYWGDELSDSMSIAREGRYLDVVSAIDEMRSMGNDTAYDEQRGDEPPRASGGNLQGE